MAASVETAGVPLHAVRAASSPIAHILAFMEEADET